MLGALSLGEEANVRWNIERGLGESNSVRPTLRLPLSDFSRGTQQRRRLTMDDLFINQFLNRRRMVNDRHSPCPTEFHAHQQMTDTGEGTEFPTPVGCRY